MLARFERLMEQAVEGSLRRVFPTTLQPVQLAKAAARAMEEAQVVGAHGGEVPNSYRLRLAPIDLQRFVGYRTTLVRDLSDYLAEYALDRRLRPIAEPRVELIEDATVRAGSVRAEARFVDLAPERQSEVEEAIQGTRRLRLAELSNAGAAGASRAGRQLSLTDSLGLRLALDPQVALVRVGRAADNDLALANQRVSRYHAQLRWVESNWLVYDLDSTNGTFVDEQRVLPAAPRAIAAGAVLRLGDHPIDVRAGEVE